MIYTSSGGLWLVNRGTNDVELGAGEMFGFNVGTFTEVAAGAGSTTHQN